MIIANDLPFVRSVIEDAKAGICYSSDDLSSLVTAVHKVADDPDLLRRCQANARRYAREVFNWQAQGGLFHALYAGAGSAPEDASAQFNQPLLRDRIA